MTKPLKIILLILLGVLAVLLFYRPIEMGDTWWHLSSARWILENQQFPQEDMFAFSDTYREPWIYTSWLGGSIYYLVYMASSEQGLKVFRLLLLFGIVAIFFVRSYKKIPFPYMMALTTIFIFALALRCLMRPFLFNYIFAQIFLIILMKHDRDSRLGPLLLLPVINSLWFNLHPGSFVYGTHLIITFLLVYLIQSFSARSKRREDETSTNNPKKLLNISILLVFFSLSFAISPYGFGSIERVLRIFLEPQTSHYYRMNVVISESKPPMFIFSLNGIWFYFLTAFSFFMLKRETEKSFLFTLLFANSLFLFLYTARANVFYVIVCSYMIVDNLQRIPLKLPESFLKNRKHLQIASSTIFIIFAFIHIIRLTTPNIYHDNNRHNELTKMYSQSTPLKMMQFLKNHDIAGDVFNSHGLGGYLIWAAHPKLRPIKDGRNENIEINKLYHSALKNPQQSWEMVENKLGIKIALLDMSLSQSDKLAKHLIASKNWNLVLIDSMYIVFLKKGAFNIPAEVKQFQNQLNKATVSKANLNDLKTRFEARSFNTLDRLLEPPLMYAEGLDEAATMYLLGFSDAAIEKLKSIPKRVQYPKVQKRISALIRTIEQEKYDFRL